MKFKYSFYHVCPFLLICFFLNAQPPAYMAAVSRIDAFFARAGLNGFSGSALIAVNDKIIFNKGYGLADKEKKIKETENTVFNIGSITKQFTAAAILKLETEGKLLVSDSLYKYFPDIGQDKKNITIHQLLTHTAGFVNALGEDDVLIDKGDFMELAGKSTLTFMPGTAYGYSNTGYSILGIIIEKVSGTSYDDFLYKNIFLPSGMTSTGYLAPNIHKTRMAVGYQAGIRWGREIDWKWYPDGPGWNLRANGGLLSTTTDLFNWYRAIKNKTILPDLQIKKYLNPYVREGVTAKTFYSYGWSISLHKEDTIVSHDGSNGVFNAFMGMDLKHNMVIIISSNTDAKSSTSYVKRIIDIMEGTFTPFSTEYVAKYQGNYQAPDEKRFAVSFDENNSLLIDTGDPEILQLVAQGGGTRNQGTEKNTSAKTIQILTEVFGEKYDQLAEAYHTTIENAREIAKEKFGAIRAVCGSPSNISLITTVQGETGNLVAYVRMDFKRKTLYSIIAWKDDKIVSLRTLDALKKPFFSDGQNEFSTGTNNISLSENEKDGVKELRIKVAGKPEIIAKKVKQG